MASFDEKVEKSSKLYANAGKPLLAALDVKTDPVRPRISTIECPSTGDELAFYEWTSSSSPGAGHGGHDTSAKTLLLVHGYHESLHRYDYLATYFLSTSFSRVIGVDNYRHGRSEGFCRKQSEVPAGFGLQEHSSKNIADVILSKKPDCVFAQSMGGLVTFFALSQVWRRWKPKKSVEEDLESQSGPLLKDINENDDPHWTPFDLGVVFSAPCFKVAVPDAAPGYWCGGCCGSFLLCSMKSWCCCCQNAVGKRPTPSGFRADEVPALMHNPAAQEATIADPLYARTQFVLNVLQTTHRTHEAVAAFKDFGRGGGTRRNPPTKKADPVVLGPPVRAGGEHLSCPQYRHPVLLLHGRGDKLCAFETSQAFARTNKLVQFVEMEGGLQHEWFWDEAGLQYLKTVADFFKTHFGGTSFKA